MISLRYNFLYVHIPKTAGNAVQSILRHYSEDKIVCEKAWQDGVERFQVRNDRYQLEKHSTLSDYRCELGDAVFQKLFKCCCVRNPWERAISFYFSPHRGNVRWDRNAFKDLVAEMTPASAFVTLRKPHARSQSPFANVDYVIRFERLDEDFRQLCDRVGIPPAELPMRNKSMHEHFTRYYDAGLVDLVRDRFSDEITYFGYEFDSTIQSSRIGASTV